MNLRTVLFALGIMLGTSPHHPLRGSFPTKGKPFGACDSKSAACVWWQFIVSRYYPEHFSASMAMTNMSAQSASAGSFTSIV